MSCRSLLNRIRKPVLGGLATAALAVGSVVVATPAEAVPAGQQWGTVRSAPGGVGTLATCFPPTRLTTAAIWQCNVFSGEFIQAWIECSGQRFISPHIPEGSWWIIGRCPAGTVRTDEGIIDP